MAASDPFRIFYPSLSEDVKEKSQILRNPFNSRLFLDKSATDIISS